MRGIQRLNCYNNTTLSGEVNTFIVKSLQTVCLLCALVGVVFPQRHTSIVTKKSPFVSGIIVPGHKSGGAPSMLVGRMQLTVLRLWVRSNSHLLIARRNQLT